MPLQSVYHPGSHAIGPHASNPLNLVESTFAPSITKPTLYERRSAPIHTDDGDDQVMMMSGAVDTWSDCESTHAVLGADDCGGMCHTATPSPNFFISNTTYDMYQDCYIPNSSSTNADKFSNYNIAVDADVAFDSDFEEEEYFEDRFDENVEMYSRSNSIVAFYRDDVYDDEEEVHFQEEEEESFNMSFVSDVATICSTESFTNEEEKNEACPRTTATLSADSSSSYLCNHSASISNETPRSFVEHLFYDSTSDTTTPDNMSVDVSSSMSFFRVAYPSCTPAALVETRTLRSGLMPQDPTTKYRKLIRTHGPDLVHQVDMSMLYEDHLQYVAHLYRANAELTPSPFPFYSELQYQQQQRHHEHRQSHPSVQLRHQNGPVTSLEQAATSHTNSVATRPLQFLPPPPPSMQTYFVASHTFNSGTTYKSKFPAFELLTKPGTGDWSAGYGPEYAATVEDGLPASRELYDPNCEAFSKFYEVLMRWYGGVCSAQAIHNASTVGNPLIAKLSPVPSVEEYTADFIGWVRELNRWWDAEVKPKTGSLHVLLSAHSSAVPDCLRRTITTTPPSAPHFRKNGKPAVPRSLAPPPLPSHPATHHRRHTDALSPIPTHSTTTVAVSSSLPEATPAATHRAKPNNFVQCTNNNGNYMPMPTNRPIW